MKGVVSPAFRSAASPQVTIEHEVGWSPRPSLNFSGKCKISNSFPVIKERFLLWQSVIDALHRMWYAGTRIPSAIRFPFLVKVCSFRSQSNYNKNKFAGWDAGQLINGRQANLGRGLRSANRQIAFTVLHTDTSCPSLFFMTWWSISHINKTVFAEYFTFF